MKKIVYRKDLDKMPNRDRGNTLLEEGWHFKRLYLEAETDREQNLYFLHNAYIYANGSL